MGIDKIKQDIEFHNQKLKEAEASLFEKQRKKKSVKILDQKITDKYSIYNGDCVEVLKGIQSESIHYSIFSPPFAALFVYSDSERDMGNCKNQDSFFDHFKYAVPELYRIMKPGRLISLHCMKIPMTIANDGHLGLRDFPGDLIRLFESKGFILHSDITIWKDPLIQAVRTKNLTLAHKQISKDATRCAQGIPDHIITMRKPGENTEPVEHGRGFEQYIGELPDPKDKKTDNPRTNKYSHKVWQRYASPVWFDIKQTDTLNFREARDNNDERHICPLQLQTIERCLELWSNPGDVILSPFAGIGSEGYVSINMERKFIGVELKESYYKQAIKNLTRATKKQKQLGFNLT